ncbi:MAG: hypothetical protein H6765_11035 [Candidatus Peribacteria bacterium]|nr:MAG: hypothetical protein H6765_11035 [Candidatus Peribacteria bacterium]
MMLDEIRQYIDATFVGTHWAGMDIQAITHSYHRDQEVLWYQALVQHHGTEEILFQKGILLVVNKYDLYDDLELRGEYKSALYQFVIDYLQTAGTKTTSKHLDSICLPLSAATKLGTDAFLDKCLGALSVPGFTSYTDHEDFVVAPLQAPYIAEVTEDEISELVEDEYINEMDAKYLAVRAIHQPDLARLVYMLPW